MCMGGESYWRDEEEGVNEKVRVEEGEGLSGKVCSCHNSYLNRGRQGKAGEEREQRGRWKGKEKGRET